MLFQHLPIILDFVYLSTFQDSNILMVSSLFQCFQWSPYVLIVWMAFQTHSEILLMLFLLLWHFIYFYITAFVFKLRNYLENRETSSPLFTTVITLQLHPHSTLWLIAQVWLCSTLFRSILTLFIVLTHYTSFHWIQRTIKPTNMTFSGQAHLQLSLRDKMLSVLWPFIHMPLYMKGFWHVIIWIIWDDQVYN